MTKIQKFIISPFSEKLLFAEALFFVFAAKLLLGVLPFKYCRKLLSNRSAPSGKPAIQQLRQIRKAIRRTRRLVVWRNECLVTSVAARWMLQRRRIPSLLSLGLALDENKKLIAHAWLRTEELELVEKGGDYRELYRF